MNYTYWVGAILCLVLLIPAAMRAVSKALNRKLARRLATGPVGVLLQHNYSYAMDLSRMAADGELSEAEAGALAESWLFRNLPFMDGQLGQGAGRCP